MSMFHLTTSRVNFRGVDVSSSLARRDLMQDPTEYLPAIKALPPLQRDFFETDFMPKSSGFKQTKEQIRYRLQAIIENPTLARLFTAPETKVDLFTEMNRGAIILIDTAADFLKSGSATFGKVVVSLLLQAIMERAAIPAEKRKPTFVFIDEAADLFDSNIDNFLTDARKYKAGLHLAHQHLDQCSSSLKASLAANTGAKFASGLSAGDARQMAPDMRTTADFILDQPRLQFAAYIRGVTPHAVSIPITPGALEGMPQLAEWELERLLEENRRRVSLPQIAAIPFSEDYDDENPPSYRVSPQQAGEEDDEQGSEW
jgi:hypothetical protein